MRFESNSIFKVFYTFKITLSYTETYSMKHSWVLQVSKFVLLSESHWNRELKLESIFTDVESVIFLLLVLLTCIGYLFIAEMHIWGIYVQKSLLSCSCTVFEIWTYSFSTHIWRNHDNMVFFFTFYIYLTCWQPECNGICVSPFTY